jgi:hypothetical protein
MKRQFLAISVLVLVALAWVIGSRSRSTGSKDGPPPFTVIDAEVKAERLMGTYVPSSPALKLEERPPPREWRMIEDSPDAIEPDRSVVQVTLRPKQPGEELILTGIHFDVDRRGLRPLGTVFYKSCKRHLVGPAIDADLDTWAYVQDSSAALGGTLSTGLELPSSAEPIEFPWTVSLDKPLRLYLVVHAEHSYCSWSARISWHSDSSEGVIHVDNGGKGYKMTDTFGIGWLHPVSGHWVEIIRPSWTGGM